jgi:hypothetical protein
MCNSWPTAAVLRSTLTLVVDVIKFVRVKLAKHGDLKSMEHLSPAFAQRVWLLTHCCCNAAQRLLNGFSGTGCSKAPHTTCPQVLMLEGLGMTTRG